MPNDKKILSSEEYENLFLLLKTRFEENMNRHKNIEWNKIQKRLENSPQKLWSLNEMELTGGEPDVIGYNKRTNNYIFCDCSTESPIGRRNVCYDHVALESRKQHKPQYNAIDMATEMGIEILTEDQYQELQKLGAFDLKSSSWIKTPTNIRALGGALFCDRRYNHVFLYHNGAESYYSNRGFRGLLNI